MPTPGHSGRVKAWIPTLRELPGLLLVFAVGTLAFFVVKLGPKSPYLSDLIIAILFGGLIVNTRIAKWVGLGAADGRDNDRYERGLRYTGKFVLRIAIILMGFKIQTSLFRADQALILGAVLVCAMPTAFFVTHVVAARLGLRREMGDLLAIGSMVCGASAINALAPAINARRRDQGLAITAVFIFTLFALLTFYPLANLLELSPEFSGLWAGLAVNDLSGSIAVGAQFGDDPALVATAAKSARIILLGPLLIGFSVFRRTARTTPEGSKTASITAYLPLFILGYFACFGLRIAGDAAFGSAPGWASFLQSLDVVIKFCILAVCAGIGVHINIKVIIELGWKAVVAGGAASIAMAGLSLAMLVAFARDVPVVAVAVGVGGAACSWVVYRLGRGMHPQRSALGRRFASGAPLSVREAIDLLEAHDVRETLTPAITERVLRQLYPAIGELQPLRESAIIGPIRYRRMLFWESKRESGSLVGILWPPGTQTHIHSHNYDGLGKSIEGRIETVDFERIAPGRIRMSGRTEIGPGTLMKIDGRETLHAVLNPTDRDAIDIHFYGPALDYTSERFDPTSACAPASLTSGQELIVEVENHEFPADAVPEGFWSKSS